MEKSSGGPAGGTARRSPARLGFELRDAATGGASDANTTAGMGVPTLDGLGPIGGGDHSQEEYLELDRRAADDVARRAATGARPRSGDSGVAGGEGAPIVTERSRVRDRRGRRRVSSGGPWEATAGLQPGGRDRQFVLGLPARPTQARMADPRHPDDVGGQARAIFAIVEHALNEAGFGLADVVRTRMFVTDISRGGIRTARGPW